VLFAGARGCDGLEACVLSTINPEAGTSRRPDSVPALLTPLLATASRRESLVRSVQEITESLGFDSFMYGASASPHPTHESKSYVFTTLPREWVARYDQRAYIEVDPRILHCAVNSIPLIWDRGIATGQTAETKGFIADAAAHGVGSGVALGIRDARGLVIVALNSAKPDIDDKRNLEITHSLGDILLFGIYFHELFMKNVAARGVAPRAQGAPLSNREKQCLALAARGYSTHDIADELAITERTIQFHFDSIRSKLEATNRQEAIAKAIAMGVVDA